MTTSSRFLLSHRVVALQNKQLGIGMVFSVYLCVPRIVFLTRRKQVELVVAIWQQCGHHFQQTEGINRVWLPILLVVG